MKLFHVSDRADIGVFRPRAPLRGDMDKAVPLVWAVDERRLPNYLTPRDCPRVTFHPSAQTDARDVERFLCAGARHCVAIEHGWFDEMRRAVLYIYELDPAGFYLQDECAGYYVSEREQTPLSVTRIDDLFAALFERRVEVRLLENLWPLADTVQRSTLNWSLIRMQGARARG